MNADELLNNILQKGVVLWVENGELRLRAAKGVLTPAMREELQHHKTELLGLMEEGKKYAPTSFAQQRLWFLSQLNPEDSSYVLPVAMNIRGPLNTAVLEKSFQEIINRHELLRSSFTAVSGHPIQVIAAHTPFTLSFTNLNNLAKPQQETQIQQLITHLAKCPFDLTRDLLLRVQLVQLGDLEYMLLLTIHHIVSDMWSMGVLMQELTSLYESFITNNSRALPPLQIQYAEFAAWQHQWLQGEVLTKQLHYWQKALTGAPPTLDLPTDHPRPAIQTMEGLKHNFILPEALTQQLKTLSRAEDASLFMVLLAAFNVLLHRYTGQTDICVGSPVANRNRVELEPLIGLFLNTLVFRTQLAGHLTFRQLLGQVRKTALEAYAHQDLPFERLVEVLQPVRDLSRSPLFQVMFAMQPPPQQVLQPADLTVQLVESEQSTMPFDLSLLVWEKEQQIHGSLEYNTRLFDTPTVSRLVAHWQILLAAIVADPDRPLSNLPLLTEPEKAQLVTAWNDTAMPFPAVTLPQLFDAQATQTPHKTAVSFATESWTYAQLNQRAEHWAGYLQTLGVGPELLVGLHVERSLEMMAALLGILKAGGAYLPLDPAFPPDRIAFMLADAQVSILLTEPHLSAKLPALSAKIIHLDQLTKTAELPPAISTAQPYNLAYVIYTSGSTGKPKGVQIPHAAVVNFLTAMLAKAQPTSQDVFVAVTTLSFDISVLELFLPLISGGHLVLASREVASDGDKLAACLNDVNCTMMQATPATWRLLLHAGWPIQSRPQIFCGGEALPLELAQALRERSTVLWNLYGPTETTIWSTIHRLETIQGLVPLGHPLHNTQLYVLDAALQPVPVGVPGELCIGGAGLARGYLKRPKITAEKFIPHPFSQLPGERLYRTGDRVRYHQDGTLEFLGRVDHQVKVRGFRIEPGEIEVVLRQHPDIQEAVVLAQPEPDGTSQRLVAYFVSKANKPAASELRSFLRPRLPEYMIPSLFILLETMPLTPNGKINRQALPKPDDVLLGQEKEYVPPRTAIETALADIWETVLRREKVSMHNSFFELGGHSLLATAVITQIRKVIGVDIPLRLFFQEPTIAGLAHAVAQQQATSEGQTSDTLLEITPDPLHKYDPFLLTDVQQAYWIGRSGNFALGNVATHIYTEFLTAGLDLIRLTQAWQLLIDRHDMLRATVLPDGRQQILPTVLPYQIKTVDLRGRAEEEKTAEIEAIRAAMSHQVLPADQWPLFEVRAAILDEKHIRIHFSFDLLLGDAWSIRLLAAELLHFYQFPDTQLPSLQLSFRDYVLADRALQDSAVYQQAATYWRNRLATLPPAPELPLAKSPQAIEKPRFGRYRSQLEPAAWQKLKEHAARAGLTPSGLLLAAYAEVLATWSKSPRFTINLTLFNRLPLHPQVQAIIGDFTSLTLLEVNHAEPGTFTQRARRIQQRLWEDLDHRYVSGVQVLRELRRSQGQTTAEGSMPVVFTSTLDLNVGADNFTPPFTHEMDYNITQTPQVWIDHQVGEAGGELVYNWDVVEELFPAGMIGEMFAAYQGLLERLAKEEAAWQQEHLVGLPDAQQKQRTDVNATQKPVPSGLLHSLFLQQAAKQPNAVAVITPSCRLSYAQLSQQANQVGHWLRERGASPNQLVGVVMEKGWEQVVAVLGVLQAGAAYLPIDASLPQERIHYLLENGQVQLALTQSWVAENLTWPGGVQWVSVDGDGLRDMSQEGLEVAQTAENLAYVIFTSGSTGQPKGVMIDHRGALNTVVDLNERFSITPQDRVLGLSALNFDLSVYDIFGVLGAGGAVVLPRASDGRDPAEWLKLVQEEQVTVWNTVPALMKMLVEYAKGQEIGLPDSLRLVMMSGDWIPVDLPPQIQGLLPQAEIFSLGGATEASIWSILYPIRQVPPEWVSIPYGKPMWNQTFHVLDEGLQPRPIWVPGELYIGGIGLAKGYWRDEAKTAARFITHPNTGERLYRTGDLGRYLPDGEIEFLGREDFQVKVQGYRIELGEVEAALLQHPLVQTAVVAAVGENQREKRLVAYLVGQRHTPPATPPAIPPDLSQDDNTLSGLERLEFKLQHHGIRQEPHRPRIQLHKPVVNDELRQLYRARRSERVFASQPIPFAQFSQFLGCLMALQEGWQAKYRYPSAGSLYPVQTYLHVRPQAVQGVAAGVYYYHPEEGDLVLLSENVAIDREVHAAVNQGIFDQAGFSLFLVGKLDAIEPLYGQWARDFCLLEAGYMGQLLMMTAPTADIGLCPIGTLNFEEIRPFFHLQDDHVLLHSFLGGRSQTAPLLELSPLDTTQTWQPTTLLTPETVAETMREFLKEKLPSYMIPSAFVLMDTLPLTANGKVDRQGLPSPQEQRAEASPVHALPQTDLEQTIATILQQVLQLEAVGLHDNFFDLGGTSVHMVQAHARLCTAIGKTISITELFTHPTVYSLAEFLGQPQPKEATEFKKIQERSQKQRQVTNPQQERLKRMRRGNE